MSIISSVRGETSIAHDFIAQALVNDPCFPLLEPYHKAHIITVVVTQSFSPTQCLLIDINKPFLSPLLWGIVFNNV